MRLDQLRRLSQLDLFNKASFDQIQDELASLQSCWQLEDKNLEKQAICPHCHFRPSTPSPPNPISGADLDRIDQRLSDMLHGGRTLRLNSRSVRIESCSPRRCEHRSRPSK